MHIARRALVPAALGSAAFARETRADPSLAAPPLCAGAGSVLASLVFDDGPRVTCVQDARAAPAPATLERDGFSLVSGLPAARDVDVYSPERVVAEIFPVVASAVARETGAARVLVFDHVVRNAERKAEFAASSGGGGGLSRGWKPASAQAAAADEPKFLSGVIHRMHNDYSMGAGVERARTLLEPFADPARLRAALRGRVAIVNAWLPTRVVEKDPLALCRFASVRPRDVAVTRFHYKTRVGEVYRARSADEQQWVYFSAMKPPECLLFKTFDSAGGAAAGGDVARFALHGAFELPAAAPDAPARESIELRCLVLFDEGAARDDFLLRPFVAPHIARVCGDPSVGLSATGHEPMERRESLEPRDTW